MTTKTPKPKKSAVPKQQIVHPPSPWSACRQKGKPGHCFAAQVFDAEGNSLAVIGPMDDARQATATAKLMAAAPELLDLVRRAYMVIHRGQWEEGETDAELSRRINDVMSNNFGVKWVE